MQGFVSLTAFVHAVSFSRGDAFSLTAAAVFVVFTGNYSKHVQEHTVDGLNHAFGEVVSSTCFSQHRVASG
ncbi:hypothetical protein D3C77_573250 [compost metagenome]